MKIKNMNLREIVNQNDRLTFITYCRNVLCTQHRVPNTLDSHNYDGTFTMAREGCDDMMWLWIKLFTINGVYPNKGGRKYNIDDYEEIANYAILGVHLLYEAWYCNRRLNPCFVFDVMDLCGIAYEENVSVYDIAKIVKSVLRIKSDNDMPYYKDSREFQAQRIIVSYGWLQSGYDCVSLKQIFDKLLYMLQITEKIQHYRRYVEYNAYFSSWEEMCNKEKDLEDWYKRLSSER